jgi:putative tryptophan/tyrosine transport system substrate-binding protein
MKRREFITLLGGAATWPLAARAQQPAMPVVGFLRNTIAPPFAHLVTELGKGLSEEGFVEGRNVIIEQRWGDNQPDRLPGLAADLVRRKAAVIVCNSPAVVARAAGPTVPIVFVVGDDPVKMGLVGSLSRPEGNLTGVTFFGGSLLGAKRLALLHELVPKISVVAVLLDPDTAFEIELVETAARTLGLQIVPVTLASERDLDAAFDRIVATGAGALLFGGGPVLRGQLQQIVALAARHALPTIYELRDYVEAGGLISYAASFPAAYRQAGVYAGRILKGAKPSDLPVLQPTKFEMAINLKTAKALGLTVPQTLLVAADEVIE